MPVNARTEQFLSALAEVGRAAALWRAEYLLAELTGPAVELAHAVDYLATVKGEPATELKRAAVEVTNVLCAPEKCGGTLGRRCVMSKKTGGKVHDALLPAPAPVVDLSVNWTPEEREKGPDPIYCTCDPNLKVYCASTECVGGSLVTEWIGTVWKFVRTGDRVRLGTQEAEVETESTSTWHVDPNSNKYNPLPMEHDRTAVRLVGREGLLSMDSEGPVEVLMGQDRYAIHLLAQQFGPVNEVEDGIVYPCQPIGCDAGIHLPGCRIAAEMEE
jgi:hypothetical protein